MYKLYTRLLIFVNSYCITIKIIYNKNKMYLLPLHDLTPLETFWISLIDVIMNEYQNLNVD